MAEPKSDLSYTWSGDPADLEAGGSETVASTTGRDWILEVVPQAPGLDSADTLLLSFPVRRSPSPQLSTCSEEIERYLQPSTDQVHGPPRPSADQIHGPPQASTDQVHGHPQACTEADGGQPQYSFQRPTWALPHVYRSALVGGVPLHFTSPEANRCKDVYRGNPKALGLAVLMCCRTHVRDGNTIDEPGMENSVQMMRKVFTKLGYAVLVLGTSPTHEDVVRGVAAIASQPIPKSYKRFFFYICAHGFEDGIHAYDDDVTLNEIVKPLCDSNQLQSVPLVFLFDSCRTRPSRAYGVDIDRQNTMIVRATFRNCPTLAEDGCGFFTHALARVLSRVEDTLINVVNKHVPEEMKSILEECPENVLLPDAFNERVPVVSLFGQLEEINLVEEMEQMEKRRRIKSWIWNAFLGVLLSFVLIFGAVGTGTYINGSKHHEKHLGMGGDLIVGGTITPLWQSAAHITECVQPGDITHNPFAYFVPRADLDSLPSKEILYHYASQVNSSGTFVLPGDQDYLMWDSEIAFDICLSHPSTLESSAEYTVVGYGDPNRKPVCKGYLPVSDSSEANCTRSRVRCKIHDPGYYAVQLSLKAGTFYDANVQLITTHLNYSFIEDYVEKECGDITDIECKFHSHLTDSEHVILVYIRQYPPYVLVPHTTHICVSYKRSLFYVFFFVPFGLLSICFLVCAFVHPPCCLRQCCLRTKYFKYYFPVNRRRGYSHLS